MRLMQRLWQDEAGAVLSAEMVVLGTVGVLGMTAGISALTDSVNSELSEVGQAFRSFDQSYSVHGYQTSYGGTGSHTVATGTQKTGSAFVQAPAQESVAAVQLRQMAAQPVILTAPGHELAGRIEAAPENAPAVAIARDPQTGLPVVPAQTY